MVPATNIYVLVFHSVLVVVLISLQLAFLFIHCITIMCFVVVPGNHCCWHKETGRCWLPHSWGCGICAKEKSASNQRNKWSKGR